jgi:hypothetical protein
MNGSIKMTGFWAVWEAGIWKIPSLMSESGMWYI